MSRYSGAPPTKATIDALGADATTLAGVAGAGYMQQTIDGNGYPALVGGGSGGWARTTNSGILPYAAGVSGVGTPSWPFSKMYSSVFYEGGVALNTKYAQLGQINTFTQQQNFSNANSFVRSGGDGQLILGASSELYRQNGASYYTVITSDNIGAEIAAITVGAVGDVAMLVNTVAEAVTAGVTYPGSQLRYSGMVGGSTSSDNNNLAGEGATPAGTWVALGNSTTASYTLTLFKRIA